MAAEYGDEDWATSPAVPYRSYALLALARPPTPRLRVPVFVRHVIDPSTHLHQTGVLLRTYVRRLKHCSSSSITSLFSSSLRSKPLTHPLSNAVTDTSSLPSTSPRPLPFSVLSEMLPKNLLSLARRGLHSKTRTFYSPTPDFLHEYLSQDSLASGSLSVFMLSTSLPDLPGHLSVLQAAFPNSIGSFSVSPPGSEPTVSLATFWGTDIKVFKSDLTGRAPAEVGRFQRPERQRSVPPEDRRGSTSRDVDAAYGQGWEKLWNGEVQNERIAELEGVQADTFLLLSDSRPAPVLRALDNMFPKAIKVGS